MARRAANGEGSVSPRKDGRWEAILWVTTTTGVRKRIRRCERTRKEAHDQLVAMKAAQQQGTPEPGRGWRVDAYLDYWLEQAVRTKRRPLTYRRAESVVRLHIKPYLGKHTLKGLSVLEVQTFLDQRHAAGISEAGIFQIRKVLSAALTWAMRQELIFRNVARLVELPTYRPGEAEYWSAEEVSRFLEVVRGEPLHALFVVLTLYGLRRGEVLGIRWCDVDFKADHLWIRQQVQRVAGELQEVPLKTASSYRDEPLLGTVRQVLLKQRVKQTAAREAAGDSWRGSGDGKELIFTTSSGRPIEARNVFRSFQRICKQHDLRIITLHGLRHSNGTLQKNLGVPDRDVQVVLGHSNTRTTAIYQHVDMTNKRTALEKVEHELFDEDGGSSRSRQRSRQSHFFDKITTLGSLTKKTPHLFTSGVLSLVAPPRLELGTQGSSERSSLPSQNRITEVRGAVKRAGQQWILGAVAVSVAVKIDHKP